jgi:hypothetical protein
VRDRLSGSATIVSTTGAPVRVPQQPLSKPSPRRSGRLSRVPRSPEQIQQEIDAARESLAATLDELAFQASPKRLSDQAKTKAQAFLQSPPGMAVMGAVGLTVTFVATRRVVRGVKRARNRKRATVPVRVRTRRR